MCDAHMHDKLFYKVAGSASASASLRAFACGFGFMSACGLRCSCACVCPCHIVGHRARVAHATGAATGRRERGVGERVVVKKAAVGYVFMTMCICLCV